MFGKRLYDFKACFFISAYSFRITFMRVEKYAGRALTCFQIRSHPFQKLRAYSLVLVIRLTDELIHSKYNFTAIRIVIFLKHFSAKLISLTISHRLVLVFNNLSKVVGNLFEKSFGQCFHGEFHIPSLIEFQHSVICQSFEHDGEVIPGEYHFLPSSFTSLP